MSKFEPGQGQISQFASFARNPLGIIALFLFLVYTIAGSVLGGTAANLQWFERLPLILFLIVFPFAILRTFGDLVRNHHHKLYAPKDFDPGDFAKLAGVGSDAITKTGEANFSPPVPFDPKRPARIVIPAAHADSGRVVPDKTDKK